MTEVDAIQEKQVSDLDSDSDNDFVSSDEYNETNLSTPEKTSSRSDKVVKLDVGGQLFKTQSEPLMKKSRFFRNLLKNESIEKSSDGCIFVDRSPQHFDFILNFVRDGYAPLPSSDAETTEMLTEAKFYKMAGLIKRLANKKRELPFKAVSLDEIKAKANGELDRPLLQIFYLFKDEIGLINRPSEFSEFFIEKFLKENENKLTIQFCPVDFKFHSYTAAWCYRLFNVSGYEVYGPCDFSFKTFTQQLERDIKNIDKNQKPRTDESKIASVKTDNPEENNGKNQLLAVLTALNKVSEHVTSGVFNISTSDYVYKCFNEWIYQWQANGWLKKDGTPAANQYLLKIIFNKIRELRNNGKRVNIEFIKEEIKQPTTSNSP